MTNIIELIDDLIKLENKSTFCEQDLVDWVQSLEGSLETLNWNLRCPCKIGVIHAYDAKCPEREIIHEDYLEQETNYPFDTIEEWVNIVDYCASTCERGDIYNLIKDELRSLHDILNLSDEFKAGLNYLIEELKKLI